MKETEETAEQKAPPQKKEKETAIETVAQPMIYIGPSIRSSDLSTYKVFADGIPEAFKDDPIHAPLFVSPESLDAARAEVGETGSLLNVLYQKAVQEHEEKERR